MRLRRYLSAASFALLIAQTPVPRSVTAPAHRGYVPHEIVVELRAANAGAVRARLDRDGRLPGARTGIASLDALSDRFGVARARAVLSERAAAARPGPASRLTRFFHINLSDSTSEFEAIEAYRAEPAVASAQLVYQYEPDLVPNDPYFQVQYSHTNAQAAAGWEIETGSASIVIAVIGTGVEPTHPDLAAHLVAGYDFVDGDTDPSPAPGEGHETSVAGVAAAVTDNADGIAGVCWGCGIMPLRVAYTTVDVAQAIDFARTHGARVINMSFGNYDPNKYGPDTLVETAVDEADMSGIVLVATAGNDAIDLKRYPGALDKVIGVAAVDIRDQRASFSNFGDWVDVAAAGDDVWSTTPGGSYDMVSGTSFSAPYVSGLAGLILSRSPQLAPETVRLIIDYTADVLPVDRCIGSGRVNVARAVARDTPPPLFAVIKSPWGDVSRGGAILVRGTALGDGYRLEYREDSSLQWTTFAFGAQTIDGTLGTLDASLPQGHFRLRLTANLGTWTVQHEVAFTKAGPYAAGWPVFLGTSVVSAPTLADLDGDGAPEILVGASNGSIWALRADGTSLPGWPRSMGAYAGNGPSVGDVDGDGDSDVVGVSLYLAIVSAWRRDGTPIGGFPVTFGPGYSDMIYGAPALANLDGDPALEVVVVTKNGWIHVLNAPGATELPGWPRSIAQVVPGSAAVGDVDGDGAMEIVVRSESAIHVFETDGTEAAGWPRSAPFTRASPALGDLDGDGRIDIVDAATSGVSAWRGDGAPLFTGSLYGVDTNNGAALADVDNDGRLEIFWGNFSNLAQGIDYRGYPLPGWPVLVGDSIAAGLAIADLDGDPGTEIAVPKWDYGILALNRDGSNALQPPIVVGDDIQRTPAVGDLKGDGHVELVTGTLDGYLHVFTLQGLWSEASAEWPMHQADAAHTGHYRFAQTYTDSDGDGERDLTDCAPLDPAIHHGAAEVCNGLDEDCSGVADDPFDVDRDGFATCEGDCDDARATVYPGAPQICDGINDDCSDASWPAVPAAERDADGDGSLACADCDETSPLVFPGAPQVCGDGVNNDCDDPGWPDPGGTETDADGDGFAPCAGDCDDAQGAVYPGAAQICGDGLNNDCDDPAWPVPVGEKDDDGDGHSACPGSPADDCDDANAYVWASPGPVGNPRPIGSDGLIVWSAPANPGGTVLVYDVLRSSSAGDFVNAAVCIESGDGADRFAQDVELPPDNAVFFYLVRAVNACPPPLNLGSLDNDSSGHPRAGRTCL